ncbi:MAG TPA: zinc transporter ZupT [Candidatus Gallibacteroides avistercoris]|uniref:Zinc transporter ZupT n=1 Tax=Candidatus Gallibacteroides avistercoris TaxID=2840833 RepID=A0A9D1SC29_9BACT|nr:zinc transporter ZupT [Candidatus Gallibacteroides avistercoris]
MTTQTILIAFGLTMIAGLSTGLGSILAFFTKRSNNKALSGALGLSAGVMVYISFMEMIPQSLHLLSLQNSEQQATIYMLLAFFGGIALIWGIDLLIPEDENPHEMHRVEEVEHKSGLKRTGIMLALAIGIHNFPEGLATFASTLSGMDIAIPIVIAIAIHNIPEGIAVSVPIYHATGNRKKAFWYSFLSGMAEPLGALLGFLVLLPFWSDTINALLLAFVSGIMVFIAFDELLPGAEKYGHHHWAIGGVVCGMLLMAGSLLVFM